MTGLKKVVRRRTERVFDHHQRRIVVQLEPGDILAMREERRKGWVRISIQSLYIHLVHRDAVERVRKFEKRTKELIKLGLEEGRRPVRSPPGDLAESEAMAG